jgi:hypothetical protein
MSGSSGIEGPAWTDELSIVAGSDSGWEERAESPVYVRTGLVGARAPDGFRANAGPDRDGELASVSGELGGGGLAVGKPIGVPFRRSGSGEIWPSEGLVEVVSERRLATDGLPDSDVESSPSSSPSGIVVGMRRE